LVRLRANSRAFGPAVGGRFGYLGELGDAEGLAAGAWIETGGPDQAFGFLGRAGPGSQRRAERLAALAKRGVDDRKHLLAGRRGRRWVGPGERDQA
jgi:hypothetical protein